jgi:hypothetical protein
MCMCVVYCTCTHVSLCKHACIHVCCVHVCREGNKELEWSLQDTWPGIIVDINVTNELRPRKVRQLAQGFLFGQSSSYSQAS